MSTDAVVESAVQSNRLPAHRSSGTIRGDHDLNPEMGPPSALREAAVLVPLVDRPEELTVIFTQRTATLSAHAGQISFPGGRMEPEDERPEDTALRETAEEIGLERGRIEIVGRLDTYVTRTGFRVTPVVGVVTPPFILTPDPTEVAEVFEVPLSFILDPSNPQRHSREFLGKPRWFYAFPYQQRYIWGATAGMLVNLRDVLGVPRRGGAGEGGSSTETA
ncbi:CoA pyrophosphatase [Azospirillum sp. TSO35-2]|uniref:CoA pyrophosphatase n=1 Tax=Azospirillum sp. TSO35-2 TaxID=716796 RepID=UPI000D60B206|nr:CoA pyrophosphatase [Azospirillum sp. TSO35-2]PWC32398.1 NUDIX hydrolase [Azospirillum sp. TSO35-2]